MPQPFVPRSQRLHRFAVALLSAPLMLSACAAQAPGQGLWPQPAEQPATGGTILQGHLEESNVQPVQEIARMIEVQRAYELGQSFMDQEDKRMRGVVETLGR